MTATLALAIALLALAIWWRARQAGGHGLDTFWETIKSRVLLRWVQADLKKRLRLLEAAIAVPAPLRGRTASGVSVPFTEAVSASYGDYASYMFASIYSTGSEPPELGPDLETEGRRITDELTAAFTAGLDTRTGLESFIPYPPDDLIERIHSTHGLLKPVFDAVPSRGRGPLDTVFRAVEYLRTNDNGAVNVAAILTPTDGSGPFAPSARHYAKALWDVGVGVIDDLRMMAAKFEIRFGFEGEIRCFYNLMNLRLHFLVLHGRVVLSRRERELMFAAAALHPLQDDYVDSGEVRADALGTLRRRLEGWREPAGSDERLAPIIRLVDVIYRHLPPRQHPRLVEIFCALQDWQVISREQRTARPLALGRLLEISCMKGGYAFAFYGYLVLGSLTLRQFRHFFAMGSLFQLMDDLHDVEDDLAHSVETVWTRELAAGRPLDAAMFGTLAVQRHFESATGLNPEFQYPVLVRMVELFGARYDTFRFACMNFTRLSDGFRSDLQGRFPFPVTSAIDFFAHTRTHETLDNYRDILMELMDRFGALLSSEPRRVR